jgi:GNAT superfamily N-acetyltransferase
MVDIREANLEELTLVVDLWEQYRKEYEDSLIKEKETFRDFLIKDHGAREYISNQFKDSINSEDGILLAAFEDTEAIGFCHCYIKDNYQIYRPLKLGYIDIYFIKPQFRGKGISTRFRDLSNGWFKLKGITQVTLDVYPENKSAYNIYKKWGFEGMCINMKMNI